MHLSLAQNLAQPAFPREGIPAASTCQKGWTTGYPVLNTPPPPLFRRIHSRDTTETSTGKREGEESGAVEGALL